MIHYKRHIIIVSLIFCSFISDYYPGDIQSALLSYYNKYPSEKIYLQTDGSFYTTGETIWYKVFCIAYDMPSGISKIFSGGTGTPMEATTARTSSTSASVAMTNLSW